MKNNLKKIALISLLSLLTNNNSAFADNKYTAVDEFSKDKFSIEADKYLKNSKLTNLDLNFNEKDLLVVLQNTKEYYQKHGDEDPVVKREGILFSVGVSLKNILETIDFMIDSLQEDIKYNKPIRLKDHDFINKNFKVIRWLPYNAPDKNQKEQIRITKYAIFTHQGSKTKNNIFNIPLYSIKSLDTYFLKRYSKQDILSGIYEKGGKEFGKVEPMVYLTREGLEEALMEGTILINFPDKTSKMYNVDKNNGIAYIKGLNPKQQKRYWYFKQVDNINGYGNKIENRIKIKPGVTFAGDVFNIGIGRIVALEYSVSGEKKIKLGIIGDTGGAFLPNLFQLDYLAGIYKTKQDFINKSKSLPPYVNVYFLIKK